MRSSRSVIALLLPLQVATAFLVPNTLPVAARSLPLMATLEAAAPTPVDQVIVLKDAQAVGDTVRNLVKEAADEAIAARGYFALAIPGGSILKMLVGDDILQGIGWTSRTTLAYVNHKCVAMDDADLATHAKACNLFMNKWFGVNAIVMAGTDDGDAEAASYEAKLKALSEAQLPRDASTGLPVFDLALIGVGDDGHVGSLYPNRDEVLVGSDGPWVLPVAMKSPPSITLTLPVMAAAKKVVVAACGVSDKYPQGKSEGMRRAIADPTETIQTFPAVGLRPVATWIMDEPAASKLGGDYNS
ncbi:Probable 6-phosphogluconolactonase 4, chloroplastic [Seminavis robusta]|uniref:Probable 6-phosphogluconolactonase 4, chloroplastic n=1 Tax=Seminavis robusta TaxID=568900 RepID=A0A9N8HLI3_9STRA|nr:Probable 6-phosphogluconolactonase 4, chloroplastic [Seminavis robusta]|eukprot:Sro1033_g233680.1 Probable 6-phosphogluconolactonase 4, chloroplastic (301) ;mRNA; r:12976-13878